MSNISVYPLIDQFETTLSQEWDGNTWTIYVNATPGFTFPAWVTTYVVVDADNSRIQVAEISAYDASAKTMTVSNVTIEKGAWVNYSATTHSIGAKVRISNNYAFWKAVVNAISNKIDSDGDWSRSAATDYAGMTAKSLTEAQRDALTPTNWMIILNTTSGVLNQYIGWSWTTFASGTTPNASTTVAGKVEIATDAQVQAETDTGETWAQLVATPSQLSPSKLTDKWSLTWADRFRIADSADSNNAKSVDIDDIRDAIHASTTQKGTVELATDAEAIAGTDETRYVNPKQLKNWAWFTWWYGGWCIARSDSQVTTAWSDAIIKDIEITNIGGSVSLYVEVRDISNDGDSWVIKIYKNDSDTWLMATFGYDPVDFDSFTFKDITVSAGDHLQIWAQWSTTDIRVKNFRILATPIPNYWIPTVVL